VFHPHWFQVQVLPSGSVSIAAQELEAQTSIDFPDGQKETPGPGIVVTAQLQAVPKKPRTSAVQ
jgi:hypothetical protein